MLVTGGVVIALVALVAGASGFGLGLLATPLLLLTGFSLPFGVTVNVLMSLATRIAVAYRFRRHISRRRALVLVTASVPGLYLGAETLTAVDESRIKLAVGVIVMAVAVALAVLADRPPPPPLPGGEVAAGFLGGFLGTTASLNGVPPVLLLAREQVRAASFFADLAVYAIASAGIGVALLALTGGVASDAFYPAFVVWLPGALAGNFLGTALGARLPQRTFRLLTLAVVFVAGGITAVSAR